MRSAKANRSCWYTSGDKTTQRDVHGVGVGDEMYSGDSEVQSGDGSIRDVRMGYDPRRAHPYGQHTCRLWLGGYDGYGEPWLLKR